MNIKLDEDELSRVALYETEIDLNILRVDGMPSIEKLRISYVDDNVNIVYNGISIELDYNSLMSFLFQKYEWLHSCDDIK